ncbi:diaminopimelate epimerase [Blattabacterium sp. (Cryptocercus punctulatus) str. Cpu]|uniref:diaminopimelate epimerase n=1 Tax=Blattabacterium sp. (Cryptocercus punctulatus) str. Cpu TaxID=1075399 RepID=UPI000238712A|nr:diaminopimelate epimerase [Blattabacterium sp. (Cryptocercus punctulatus) str. Cpu]AEU09417.1 diaminopimelate epimerase [Blattabacterium sp. (Cryptocercus punctulatus) str. Cpu]
MKLNFFKYQGTGNDFIILDIRKKKIPVCLPALFTKLCNRNFGIGADGIILIKNDSQSNFYMKYYNSDGKESTMCGNGARCAILFSKKLGIKKKNKIYFRAIDGIHYGIIKDKNLICINLMDIEINMIQIYPNYTILNTGSPHYILFVENIQKIDVNKEGRKIRFQKPYEEDGINVNFVEVIGNNMIKVRTYERGVEKETLSCGTGVTASSIAAYEKGVFAYYYNNVYGKVLAYTLGGKLWISFKKIHDKYYKEINLTGSVKFIFEGYINI